MLATRMRRDDKGSTMIVAMAVLLVLGIVATSVWVKTLGGLSQASFEQRRLAALATANSGLDEAVFRVEQIDLSTVPEDYTFTGAGETADGQYVYKVERTALRRWRIVATGRSADGTRSVRAEIFTTSRYDHAIATKDSTVVHGKPDKICAFESGTTGDRDCPPEDVSVLGSAGRITCAGNGWDEVQITIYPPDGSASGCGTLGDNVVQSPDPLVLEEPVIPSGTQPLPGCGSTNATCTLDPTRFRQVVPGIYQVRNLTLGAPIQGNVMNNLCSPLGVSQNNPVIIYVTGELRFEKNVRLNVGTPNAGDGEGCDDPPPAGGGHTAVGPTIGGYYPTRDPGGFRIIRTCPSSPAEIDTQQGQAQPVVSMILDAQCSMVTSEGGPHFYLFGAAVLSQYTDNGALQVLAYDRSLASITTHRYYVSNWTEIPPVPDPTAT
jgi:hypothetical protein